MLSPKDQEFALNTTVHYAPRAYEMIRNCKATSDGLTIANVGRETPISELPPYDAEKVHSFPMVWKNPSNGRPHFKSPDAVSTRSPPSMPPPATRR
jgi:hypothetical protein